MTAAPHLKINKAFLVNASAQINAVRRDCADSEHRGEEALARNEIVVHVTQALRRYRLDI